MSEKLNIELKIQQYRQANPKLKNLLDKQILSIMVENGEITLTEVQKNSIYSNGLCKNDNSGLILEKSNTNANIQNFGIKNNDFNKLLENRINNVNINLEKAEDSNGFIGSAWSWFKMQRT